jgi:hypothetical protein
LSEFQRNTTMKIVVFWTLETNLNYQMSQLCFVMLTIYPFAVGVCFRNF